MAQPENREPADKGHPTLVHFWSISSEVSKTNLAQVAELRDQRKREGLRVIAVHVPQSEAEKDLTRSARCNREAQPDRACALDNEHKLRNALSTSSTLPVYYLFDTEGELRSSSTTLETIEDQLDQMLADLRSHNPFCAACELFLNKEAMFCSDCGSPLTLAGLNARILTTKIITTLPFPRFAWSIPIHSSVT